MLKIIINYIYGLSDCLTKRVKILDGMKKTLYALENKGQECGEMN